MTRARWGQHFLWDRRILQRIADRARLSPEDLVVEIGAGDGRLTRYLRNRARLVVAVEVDPALARRLTATFVDDPDVRVLHADFLDVDPRQLVHSIGMGEKAAFVGNIPYYITTPIIEKLVESRDLVQSATLLMQQEVAERICAKPGVPGCGSISAFVSYHFWTRRLFDVPPHVFRPRPRVTSTLVRMVPRAAPPVDVDDPELMFMTIRSGFEQRRKRMLNALAGAVWLGMEKSDLGRILDIAGIDPGARAEHISLEQFAALSNGIQRAWSTESRSADRDRHE
jgi:16S rRNA (adenine1518-N6/adenine1519-N6)-dimethyltransferase